LDQDPPPACPACALPLTGPAALELQDLDAWLATATARRRELLTQVRATASTRNPAGGERRVALRLELSLIVPAAAALAAAIWFGIGHTVTIANHDPAPGDRAAGPRADGVRLLGAARTAGRGVRGGGGRGECPGWPAPTQ